MTKTDVFRGPLEIGVLSPHNPYDRQAFSGTVFHATRALRSAPGLHTRILGPHRPPRFYDRLRQKPEIDPAQLDLYGLDAIVGLVATPLLEQVLKRCDIPCLHVTDATPAFLREAYGWQVPNEADEIEKRVVQAATAVYSSDQMADRARRDFGAIAGHATAVPFGVNLENLPAVCPRKSSLDQISLLFVGLDWERKGGEKALAALDLLLAEGFDAQLTIVGRCPERHLDHPGVNYAGYLNKRRKKDARALSELYRKAHLLLVPSQADCTPMVIAEAMSFGTPVIASDTGGVRSLIGGSTGGQVLPVSSTSEDWAVAIKDVLRDAEAYRWMSEACFERSETRLSWTSWARSMTDLIREITSRRTDVPAEEVPLKAVV